MSSSLNISLDTPEAKRLQDAVQKEIARRGWSEGEDDAVMSEYILVMLANKKTQQQITSELKDLLGEDQDSVEDVEAFVQWVWQEGQRLLGQDVQLRSESVREEGVGNIQRRSASPDERRNQNRSTESMYDENRSGRVQTNNKSDRWQSGRELLTSQTSSGGMASDAMEDSRGEPVSLSIAGRGRGRGGMRNNMFQRSVEQAHRSNNVTQRKGGAKTESIFARAGVPNPRAEEFVPSGQLVDTNQSDKVAENLLLRIDPMIPNNTALPAKTENTTLDSNPSEFPTQPLDASLCRWGIKCTSPTCMYSHASPSAVTLARQTGEEPLVLRQEPCHYQKDCTKPDCDFSHISPAVKFVLAKAERAASLAFGTSSSNYTLHPNKTFTAVTENISLTKNGLDSALSSTSNNIPCRYGSACYRQDCRFSHPSDRVGHISDRMKRFENEEADGEMEVIIPAA